ncbi:MAG: T9SS type A sorting domain-containing protein [Bacteroidia bacterium]|nr:T9SS type A sorting domain-containing protein [Bacteroidia bacterium]
MKKFLTISLVVFSAGFLAAQCTTTNATGCQCENQTQTNCDLLPDITISWYALKNYMSGPTEYSQTGNGVNNGRLKVSGSTPNIGHGSLTVRGQNNSGQRTFLCGTDTFTFPSTGTFVCPNGYPLPKQITTQRIYHKNGNNMTYWDRYAAAMTYHPSHNHIHFDDWGVFTLRIQDINEPDPRNWSIVGTGHKLGFCLMDYYQCSAASANHHCKDVNTVYNQGTTLYNGDFPNWGLGGGSYNCSVVEQGISSGYTDVYDESLDGMWINIPPGTCNGNYWIVYEVDPHDAILEEDETNNYTAVPFTLTQQTPPGNPVTRITPDRSPNLCTGDTLKLTATAGTAYNWSTGATTQSIWVSPGTYSVTVTNYCGTGTASLTVAASTTPAAPVSSGDTVCVNTSATLTALGNNLVWHDSSGAVVGTGNSFVTPLLTATTTYFLNSEVHFNGNINYVGKPDTLSTGAYSSSSNYQLFDVFRPLTIKSVEVHASGAGNRTIQLQDEIGTILLAKTVFVPNGPSRVTLDFVVQPGKNYSLRAAGSTINLWRNSAGTSYPYTMTDTLSITGCSQSGYYYYFYDWEIEVGGVTCSSPTVPVTAMVEICSGVDEEWDLDRNINVHPNPSSGLFTLDVLMPGSGTTLVQINSLLGQVLHSEKVEMVPGLYSGQVDLEHLPPGVYMLTVKIGNKNYYRRLVKQ